jgi:hypothetical protein
MTTQNHPKNSAMKASVISTTFDQQKKPTDLTIHGLRKINYRGIKRETVQPVRQD